MSYDSWKLRTPEDDAEYRMPWRDGDDEEQEPRCEECDSVGFVCDDGGPVLPCPSCHEPIQYFDREFAPPRGLSVSSGH